MIQTVEIITSHPLSDLLALHLSNCFVYLSSQLVQLDNLFAYWNVNSTLFSNHSADEALVSHPIITVLHFVATSLDLAMPLFVF